MRRWFRPLAWFKRHDRGFRRGYRPAVQQLEDRCLLAAPVLDPIQVPINIPAGKTLILPVSGTDPAGGTVNYTLQSSDPSVTPTELTGASFLKITVANFGTMEFELFGNATPQTVQLITGFVKSQFYDGLTIHRVEPNFVIQGGDPLGTGTGGPGIDANHPNGYKFNDEFNNGLIFSGAGQLALANSGPDTNGSQFFVTVNPQRSLDLRFTIFGQLVKGFDVLNAIDSVPVAVNSDGQTHHPVTPIVITSEQIVQDPSAAVFMLTSTGSTAITTNLTLTATSSTSGTTTNTLTGNVVVDPSANNDPPIFFPLPTDQVSTTSAPITIHVARSDLENDASTFTATIVDASGNAITTGANASTALTNVMAGSVDVVVTPTSGFTGTVRLKLTVADASGSSIVTSHIINVTFGDQPLTAGTSTPVTGLTEGTAPSSAVTLGTFTDADTTAAATDFHFSINWGDGTPLDTTSGTATLASGTFTVKGSHTYAQAGNYTVKVVVTDAHTSTVSGGDKGGATSTFFTSAAVADASISAQVPSINATQGTPLNNAIVGTITDTNTSAKASDFDVTINWGDGSTSAGTLQFASAGHFQVLGSHTYFTAGSMPVMVSVTDAISSVDASASLTASQTSASGTATVAGENLNLHAQAITATQGIALNNVLVGTFTSQNTSATTSQFAATIDWGDGTTTAGTIQAGSNGQFQILGSHTYSRTGTFTSKLSVTDTATSVHANASGTATVVRQQSQNERFVRKAFLDLTGLQIDDKNLQKFLGELSHGKSRTVVAREIQHLPATTMHSVQTLFLGLFHRTQDKKQLHSALNFLNTGGSFAKLEVQYLSSDNYFKQRGGGTDAGFLSAVAHDVLQQPLSATDLSTFSSELASGTSRSTVVKAIMAMPLASQVAAQNIYLQLLGRLPNAQELAAAEAAVQSEAGRKKLIVDLIAGAEFFSKV